MIRTDWEPQFRGVFERAVAAWKSGRRTPATLLDDEDIDFLAAIGCTAHELFDFVDDLQIYGEPDYETVRDIQMVRAEYFRDVMKGRTTGHEARMEDLPPKVQEVYGIPWLPRLIVKARLKLRGEMPPDLMYGCGGDRPFVRRMHTTLADFLRLVWKHGDDDRAIVDAVKRTAGIG